MKSKIPGLKFFEIYMVINGIRGGNKSELNNNTMRKRKRIRKQLEKIYLKDRKKFPLMHRLIIRLAINVLGKKRSGFLPVFLKIARLLCNLLSTVFSPGSLILKHVSIIYYNCSFNKGTAAIT